MSKRYRNYSDNDSDSDGDRDNREGEYVRNKSLDELIEGKLNEILEKNMKKRRTGSEHARDYNLRGSDIIPMFDPENTSMTVTSWINKIEQLSKIHIWDEETCAYLMQSKLAGLAKLWHANLASYDKSWSQWKRDLIDSFPMQQDYATILKEAINRRKLPNETMATYYYNKNALLMKCKLFGQKAVSLIIDGSPDQIKSSAKARAFELPEDLFRNFLSMLNDSNEASSSGLQNSSKTVYCFNCNERGHLARQCTIKQQTTRALISKCYICKSASHIARYCIQSQTNERKQGNEQILCFICKKPGHAAKICWYREQERQQQVVKSASTIPRCEGCHRPGHTKDNCWRTQKGNNREVLFDSKYSSCYFVGVLVNGVSAVGYLDTGNAINAVSNEFVQKLNLKLDPTCTVVKCFPVMVLKAAFTKMDILIGELIVNNPMLTFQIHGSKVKLSKVDDYIDSLHALQCVDYSDKIDIFVADNITIKPGKTQFISVTTEYSIV